MSYVQVSRAREVTRLFASEAEAGERNKELVKQMSRSNEKTLATVEWQADRARLQRERSRTLER